MLNLSTLLESSARERPEKVAVIFMEARLTYAQLNAGANQIANGLRKMGIEKGDKVALSCLNLPYFPMVYYGILKVGATVVPLSVLLKTEEITYHLSDSDAKAYFCFTGTAELPMGAMGHAGFERAGHCQHFVMITAQMTDPSPIDGTQTLGQLMAGQSPQFATTQTLGDDTAVIVYTSGTTGNPKGAELSHQNLLLNAMVSSDLFSVAEEDVLLIVLPLFHIFAMTVLMNTGFYRGTTNVLLPRFDATAVCGLMIQHQVTIFAGVPTMYWGLLNFESADIDLPTIAQHLRICVSGGASLPVKVLEGFEEKFKVKIYEGYGMSEGSPVVTFNQKAKGRKPGSIGTPIWGVEVKLIDKEGNEVPTGEKGELLYRGHNVMKGYYKRPEANAKSLIDGWLHSGDVAVKDEDGFYFIVDRTKDMVIRGGLNVYPREVEEVMMKHEAISLVAVIGVPDEQYGEEIKACVVLKDGYTVSELELKTWTKERIAAYKYPRVIALMDALPMGATGKILKKVLRGG